MFNRHFYAPSCITSHYAPPYYAPPHYAPPYASITPISYPVGGLGSLSSCSGFGYTGYPAGALSYGIGGGAASASSLGFLAGANVGCVTQAPPSEIVIQPAPSVITIPGPILSASCEPIRVGGHSACSSGWIGREALGSYSRYGRIGTYGLYRPYVSRRTSFGNVCRVPY